MDLKGIRSTIFVLICVSLRLRQMIDPPYLLLQGGKEKKSCFASLRVIGNGIGRGFGMESLRLKRLRAAMRGLVIIPISDDVEKLRQINSELRFILPE